MVQHHNNQHKKPMRINKIHKLCVCMCVTYMAVKCISLALFFNFAA